MTRKNSPARYTLPEVPQPDDSRCYQVNVPNDPMHIAAFQGQIKALASAYTWHNDPDHIALLAAEAWKPVFDEICLAPSPCGVEVPTILCIAGTFADDAYGYVPALAAPCSPNRVSGTGFQSCPDAGNSNTQTIVLERVFTGSTFVRNFEYHFFRHIGNGYTVSVDYFLNGSSVFHADDSVVAGGGFTLAQTVNQQADVVLIVAVANDTTSDLITADDWSMCYTGDFPLSTPPTVFTHIFDFTVDDGGFVGLDSYTHWVNGTGWQATYSGAFSDVWMQRGFDQRLVTTIEITYTCPATGSPNNVVQSYDKLSGTTIAHDTSTTVAGIDTVRFHVVDNIVDEMVVDYNTGNGGAGLLMTVSRIVVRGFGSDPF